MLKKRRRPASTAGQSQQSAASVAGRDEAVKARGTPSDEAPFCWQSRAAYDHIEQDASLDGEAPWVALLGIWSIAAILRADPRFAAFSDKDLRRACGALIARLGIIASLNSQQLTPTAKKEEKTNEHSTHLQDSKP